MIAKKAKYNTYNKYNINILDIALHKMLVTVFTYIWEI